MSKQLNIKFRTWYKGIPPRPIKFQIPGWAGDSHGHSDGDKPQPWHCPPFIEGSVYGLELIYPFDTECHVKNKSNKIIFEGDFSKEEKECGIDMPPFMTFAPHHFGFTSSLDIQAPSDHIIRLEPHPRYYTDTTGTVPCCIAGHIQTEWWPKIFFVVFKSPAPGETIIFRKGEPYGQFLVLPRRVNYNIEEMTDQQKAIRIDRENKIGKYYKKFVTNDWHDDSGQNFNDKYKVLKSVYAREGTEGVDNFLRSIETTEQNSELKLKSQARGRMKRILISDMKHFKIKPNQSKNTTYIKEVVSLDPLPKPKIPLLLFSNVHAVSKPKN